MMKTLLASLVVLAACGSSDKASTAPDGGGTADGAVGGACGGFAGGKCAADEYCDYANNTCGVADGGGNCVKRPISCPAVVGTPVCGCDGQIHSGACEMYMSGVDLNANASCTVPKNDFKCGYAVCDLANQYCLHDPKSATDPYKCVALPQACGGTSTCGCLANQTCGNACTGDTASGVTLTCS